MSWPATSYQHQPPGGYGAQPPGGSAYRPGAPPAGHYGNRPPPQQGGYGAPPPQYGAQPPPQQGGYGAPAGQGYGAPPPQTGYGAPHRASAPPPYNAPGGYAGGPQAGYPPAPPPGISPDIWGWFQAVDADRSGKITAHELQRALHNGNWTPFNAETCRLMIGMFDRDKNGTIDINEFSALWKYIQDWKSCFDRFDADRSGNISADELSNAFRTFGYNLSMNFVHVCMRTYDKQLKGNINFDDFIQCCVLLKTLTEQFRAKDTQQSGVVKIQYEEFLKMVLDT